MRKLMLWFFACAFLFVLGLALVLFLAVKFGEAPLRAAACYAIEQTVSSSVEELQPLRGVGGDASYPVAAELNAAASSLKNFQHAAGSFELDSLAALRSVDGLSRVVYARPENEALVNAMGVRTRDDSGQLRDTVDVMAELAGAIGLPFDALREDRTN